MRKLIFIILLLLVCSIAYSATKMRPIGILEGAEEIEISEEMKALASHYLTSLWSDDYKMYINLWHPSLKECVNPQSESYFYEEFQKESERLYKYEKVYSVVQMLSLPDRYYSEMNTLLSKKGQFMATKPTHMLVVNIGKEGSEFNEKTGKFMSFPNMTLMIHLAQSSDGQYYANNIPCPSE